MPAIARSVAAIVALGLLASSAFAQATRDAAWNSDDAPANRTADWQQPASAPAARLPVRFQRAERSVGHEELEAAQGPPNTRTKSIPLAPFSDKERLGARTGEVPSFLTGAASLGIVLGLFLLVVWVVRRGMPKSAALLPHEAVELLGRAPLFGKQQVHLVRCGNKILLLCASPSSVETLTEITDSDEVERLTELCQQRHGSSAPATFRQTFQQFGDEPRGLDYLVEQGADELDFGHLEAGPRPRTREPRA